jgi:5-methylcytosine-specific restriction endonuclease McrA
MSRSPRQEFRKAVQAQIKARAVDADGVRRCEVLDCRHLVQVDGEKIEGARAAQIDHRCPCWSQSATPVNERHPLTSADGWLICEVCHKAKSAREARERARTDGAAKIHAAHLAALSAKLEGSVETVAKPKRTWPTQKMKGFPTKEERQLFKKGYHHEAT